MNYVALILIVFIIHKCTINYASAITADNPPIILTRNSSHTIEEAPFYKAIMNKPMDIHFKDMLVTRGWCFKYSGHDKGIVDIMEPPVLINPSIIHVHYVNWISSALWKCKVMENNTASILHSPSVKPKYSVYYFNLHVKGSKFVAMTIDGNRIKFSSADLSDDYDGHSVYLYKDIRHSEVFCRNLESTGAVDLRYVTKGLTINSRQNKTSRLDIQHNFDNDSYVECTYVTEEPVDKYVYRVSLVYISSTTTRPLRPFSSIESTTQNDVKESPQPGKDVKPTSLIISSLIAAILIFIALSVAVFCFTKRRNTKLIEAPYGDLSNETDIAIQHNQENENRYDLCYNHLSNRVSYYITPEGVENIDPKYHQYTEVDYSSCKPKIDETQTRNSKVYDEPYAQMTMSQRKC